jgi:hypothetical protein
LICEKIVACTFQNPTKPTINEPKNQKLIKSQWQINKVYQDRWAIKLNMFVGRWQDEDGEMQSLLQD